MIESYEVYTKFSQKNKTEYGTTKVDKNMILVIKGTRDSIMDFLSDLKRRDFDLDEIYGGLRDDTIIDESSYADPERDFALIPASKINSTLMLYSDSVDEVGSLISWINYKIECECWDEFNCK